MSLLLVDCDRWSPSRYHHVDGGKSAWRVQVDGILVQGEVAPRRTKGEPVTLRRIRKRFGDHIAQIAARTGLTQQLLGAIIAVESGGNEKAERFEQHINDWSIGLTQTLTATAYTVANRMRFEPMLKPVPEGGDVDEWRVYLGEPYTSIELGASYLVMQNERFALRYDPVLLYASYNAGSPRPSSGNDWGLVCYDAHDYNALDCFAAWYGDACAVYGE